MERERSSLQADLDQRDKLHALELQKAEGNTTISILLYSI